MTGFAFISAGGLLVYLFGGHQPWIFALCLFPATIMGSCIRTPGANLMLEQQEEDTGSAVALMSCAAVLMGSLDTAVISQDWGGYGAGFGSHEHPGGADLPGTVGDLSREDVCQADN